MSETPTPPAVPHVHTGEVVEFDMGKLFIVLGVIGVVSGIAYYLWKRSQGGSLRDVGRETVANGERLIAEYTFRPNAAVAQQDENENVEE